MQQGEKKEFKRTEKVKTKNKKENRETTKRSGKKTKRGKGRKQKGVERIGVFNQDSFLENKFSVLGGFAKGHNLFMLGGFVRHHNLFSGFSLVIFCTFQ